MLPVGIDLRQLSAVRHLESLIAFGRLSEEPDLALPEASHQSLRAGYDTARSAGRRKHCRNGQCAPARVVRHCSEIRFDACEITTRNCVSRPPTPPPAAPTPKRQAVRALARQQSVDREEQLRVSELQRKSELRIEVKLTNLLVVHQPKLLLSTEVDLPGRPAQPLELVYDPLLRRDRGSQLRALPTTHVRTCGRSKRPKMPPLPGV